MGRSKKAYSLLKPNEHTPFFRVRWRDSRWRSTQTLKTVDEAEAGRLAARLYEEKLTGKRNLTLSVYAKDFFLWGKCIWLTKRTELQAHLPEVGGTTKSLVVRLEGLN